MIDIDIDQAKLFQTISLAVEDATRQVLDNKQADRITELEALQDRCVEVIEYATWHDGRYDQMARADWQKTAQKLGSDLAKFRGVEKYASFKEQRDE